VAAAPTATMAVVLFVLDTHAVAKEGKAEEGK
jgi:hypothetical protein